MKLPAALLGALLLAGCGSGATAFPATRQPLVGPLPVTPPVLRADAEDRDPELRRRSRSDAEARPVLQRLPLHTPRLSIEIAGATDGGRLVLRVQSTRGEAAAKAGYRDFLRRLGDDGRAYLPTFRPTG